MPDAATFDTYENVQKLKAAGFTEQQAEVQTRIMADLLDQRLVTRHYLDERLKELEYRLVLRLGGMIVVAIGIIATLVKLL
jgi:hypothetical protein